MNINRESGIEQAGTRCQLYDMIRFVIVFSVMLSSVMVRAQAKADRSVKHFTSAQIDSASSSKRTPDKPGRLLTPGPSQEPYLIVVRLTEGAVEIHEQYDDVAVIRAGHGVLRTGMQASGAKVSGVAPKREWLGGTINQPTEREIAAGDFLVIPAGLAHQYVPAQGDSLVYFTIKVRQGEKPGRATK